jgi:hypothetical protein
MAGALGIPVASRHVYVDHQSTAWQRGRRRPGWDAMVRAAQADEFRHLIIDEPEELLRR